MREFLKNNPMLVFGVGLPLVMVLLFTGLGNFLKVMGAPTQYDVVFASDYYTSADQGINLQVINGKLVANASTDVCRYTLPRIYRFSPKENLVREIPFNLPPEMMLKSLLPCEPSKKGGILPVSVPEMANIKLDASRFSPDGYEFLSNDYSSNAPWLVTDIFFSNHRYYQGGVLRKGNYRFPLPQAESYSNPQFIGWVIP